MWHCSKGSDGRVQATRGSGGRELVDLVFNNKRRGGKFERSETNVLNIECRGYKKFNTMSYEHREQAEGKIGKI